MWDYFDDNFSSDGSNSGHRCRRCPYVDHSKSKTTSAMATHLRKVHNITELASANSNDMSSSNSNTSSNFSRPSPVLGMSRFLSKNRSSEEWFTRLVVVDGLSFNQVASSEFVGAAFGSFGFKHIKSRSRVSTVVNAYIVKMKEETRAELKTAFDKGERFSIVFDEWTSIRNRRYLNVCLVSDSSCTNLGLVRCRGSMTAGRTVELVKVLTNPADSD